MTISVVIPLYNKAEFVGRALSSVFAQTVLPHEVMVVNDGSTDDGVERVKRFSSPLLRLVCQPNSGVSAARNAGLRMARAPRVAFLDADDAWDPSHIEELSRLADKFPQAVLMGTNYRRVARDGTVSRSRFSAQGTDLQFQISDYFDAAVRFGLPLCSSSVAVSRDTLLRVGGFPEGVDIGEDFLTWAQLACVGEVAFSGRCTAVYYRQEVRQLRAPEVPDLVARRLALLQPKDRTQEASLRRYIGLWHRMRAMIHLERGEGAQARAEIRLAWAASRVYKRDLAFLLLLTLPAPIKKGILKRTRRANFKSPVAADDPGKR